MQIYARKCEDIEAATDKILSLANEWNWLELLPRHDPDSKGTRRLDGAALPRADGDIQPGAKLHFGYRDGFSQPEVAWEGAPVNGELERAHFLLGYSKPNVSSAPDGGEAAELFRDSSYMILRWIQQDVAAFERFLTTAASDLAPGRPLSEGREFVAANLGRWRDGTPLVLSPNHPDATLADAPFTYQGRDAAGLRCPFSAHIRVVNPRDQPLANAEVHDVPRIIRRGMPYGPEWKDGEDNETNDRGIIGLFLCTNIARQFYKILHWMSLNNFSPVFHVDRLHDQDSLFGNRRFERASHTWAIPRSEGISSSLAFPTSSARAELHFFFCQAYGLSPCSQLKTFGRQMFPTRIYHANRIYTRSSNSIRPRF